MSQASGQGGDWRNKVSIRDMHVDKPLSSPYNESKMAVEQGIPSKCEFFDILPKHECCAS